MKYACLLFAFIMPLFAGKVTAAANGPDVITGVQITCRRENTTSTRQYVQPHKIAAVLTYLRLMDFGGKADADPEQLTGDSFEIILYDTNGPYSIYRQRANRFFSKNETPWVNISPVQASRLYPLFLSLQTDIL